MSQGWKCWLQFLWSAFNLLLVAFLVSALKGRGKCVSQKSKKPQGVKNILMVTGLCDLVCFSVVCPSFQSLPHIEKWRVKPQITNQATLRLTATVSRGNAPATACSAAQAPCYGYKFLRFETRELIASLQRPWFYNRGAIKCSFQWLHIPTLLSYIKSSFSMPEFLCAMT